MADDGWVGIEEDLVADGPVEVEFDPGVAARLPRMTVAAGAVFRDGHGRLLFVVPGYKPYLDIPGGIVEPGEPPSAACRREVAEELGWDVGPGRLLVVDWAPGRGPWFDQVQFVFDGGVRDPRATVELQADELVGVEWLGLEEAKGRLRASAYRRMALAVEALRDGVTIHAEFGRRLQ